MQSALAEDVFNESYTSVKDLIYHTCYRFQRRYGGDFDELFSLANATFFKVRPDWIPAKSLFSNYIRYHIWTDLLELNRTVVRRQILCPRKAFKEEIIKTDSKDFWNIYDYKLETLTSRAQFVLKLAVDPPIDLIHDQADIIRENPSKSFAVAFRSILRTYLKSLGWTSVMIDNAFKEIKEWL